MTLRSVLPFLVLGVAACHESGARPQSVPGGDAERGRELIALYGCGACHHVPGVAGAVGRVGPSFVAFSERTFIAGNLRNEPASVINWIRFPQAIAPGTVMPTLGVSQRHAADIAAYLYTIRPGALGPPHPVPSGTLPSH